MPTPAPTAKPVISVLQSVIGYLQWQAFEFQPTATGEPTKWYCTALAPGLFFDEETGPILGAATLPGVYEFTLSCENAVGLSDLVTFAMGIEASGFVQPANVLDLTIDVTTRRVSLAGIIGDVGGGASGSNAGGEKWEPLFWVKAGDDLVINVGFIKGGVQFDPKLTGLKFALKELEPENVLVAGEVWGKAGAGDGTSYVLVVHIDSDELRGALTNHEDDQTTQFLALGEFEWTQDNELDPQIGPDVIRSSTRTFGVMLPRDLIANP